MITCIEQSCLFGILYVSFMNVYQFVRVLSLPFGLVGGMWDLIALIPDRCLSIYVSQRNYNGRLIQRTVLFLSKHLGCAETRTGNVFLWSF